MTGPCPLRHFPAAPLLAIAELDSAGGSPEPVRLVDVADALRVTTRTVQRWRAGCLLRTATADQAACALGRHPSEIWPEWFAHLPAATR